MFVGRYSKVRHIREFQEQIDQAFKAHFAGFNLAAVSA